MKILILEGSPNRKGSSHMLAEDVFPVVMTNRVCRRMKWSIFSRKFSEPTCRCYSRRFITRGCQRS